MYHVIGSENAVHCHKDGSFRKHFDHFPPVPCLAPDAVPRLSLRCGNFSDFFEECFRYDLPCERRFRFPGAHRSRRHHTHGDPYILTEELLVFKSPEYIRDVVDGAEGIFAADLTAADLYGHPHGNTDYGEVHGLSSRMLDVGGTCVLLERGHMK